MDLVTLKRFSSSEEAKELTDILSQNEIQYLVVEDKDTLDSLYGDKNFSHQYFIKIQSADFDKANNLLQQLGEQTSQTIGTDHYLYAFTDEELVDLISKPDEWSEMDFHLAKKILAERGKVVNESAIQLMKEQRLYILSQPDPISESWIVIAYLFSFVGGIIGIFIGYGLWTAKKLVPNGRKVPMYSNEVRRHGFRVMVIGIFMFILLLIFRFFIFKNTF